VQISVRFLLEMSNSSALLSTLTDYNIIGHYDLERGYVLRPLRLSSCLFYNLGTSLKCSRTTPNNVNRI
jgi:hypothetical protein